VQPQRLSVTELVALVGGALLGVGVFLPWYTLSDNPNANIQGATDGPFSAWMVHDFMRWVLIVAAVAPFILAYIVLRNHTLSWARGELTAVISIAAFGLVAFNGLLGAPGEPKSEISLAFGFYLALVGTIAMIGGSVLRSAETGRRRKPPGVL